MVWQLQEIGLAVDVKEDADTKAGFDVFSAWWTIIGHIREREENTTTVAYTGELDSKGTYHPILQTLAVYIILNFTKISVSIFSFFFNLCLLLQNLLLKLVK